MQRGLAWFNIYQFISTQTRILSQRRFQVNATFAWMTLLLVSENIIEWFIIWSRMNHNLMVNILTSAFSLFFRWQHSISSLYASIPRSLCWQLAYAFTHVSIMLRASRRWTLDVIWNHLIVQPAIKTWKLFYTQTTDTFGHRRLNDSGHRNEPWTELNLLMAFLGKFPSES